MVRHLGIPSLILLLSLCSAAEPDAEAQAKPKFVVANERTLTAEQTAATIGVLPVLQRLRSLATKSTGAARTSAIVNPLEAISLNQRLLLQVTSALPPGRRHHGHCCIKPGSGIPGISIGDV